MRNLYVPLPDTAVELLRQLASREYRGAKDQAAVLILDGLRRAGLNPDLTAERPAEPLQTRSRP